MSASCFFVLHSILLCSISLSSRLSTANILGNETDRLALLAFKSQITQDPYRIMDSWNDSRHFCEWAGVICSHRHQRVSMLDLGSKGLMGSISPHIGNLSFLRTLLLFNNSFYGKLPQELGHLIRLEELTMTNNSLGGEIPLNISLCSKLKHLYLSHSNFVGKIPMEFGSLSQLIHLSIHSNKLTGGIPPSLGNLTSLKTLSLSGNHLGGSVPSTLHQLKSLQFLALGSAKLSGNFPPTLFNLSTLQTISIEDNQLFGNLPAEIGFNLPNLVSLLIGGNRFSGSIPTSLFNALGLQNLDISSNQFTGGVPLNVGNLKNLTQLTIQVNNLGSGEPGDLDFFTPLTNCSNLEVVCITANQFGGILPPSVANFSRQMSELLLDENQISGHIPTEIDKYENLIIFDLSDNLLTGNIPMGIGKLQNLGILNLFKNQLYGPLPSSINNISQLFILDLAENKLEGSIGSSLGNSFLHTLDLSYNNFTGTIPKQKIGLSFTLNALILSHNSLNGSIPLEVGNLENLEYFHVRNNKLSGEIPSTLGSCSNLEYLQLQGNFFQGSLPSTLISLRNLQVLDVSRNNLSGIIPNVLERLPLLQNLNLSFNNLEGEVPTKGVFQNTSAFSVFGNDNICGGIPKLRLPKCLNQKSRKSGTSLALKLILAILIPLFAATVLVVIYWRRKPKEKPPSDNFLGDLRRVSYNDLHRATDGFSSEYLVGTGSYGSVYKGILHPDEGPIAVKVLNLMERGASKSFLAECLALREVRHRNLLKILTVCSSVDFSGNEFKALVFEFMPNGSLESWLHPNSDEQNEPRNLNLHQRINIAIDIASALDYVHNHSERAIVHCDLKPSNVLLDGEMTAHVGDFGLAKFLLKRTSNTNGETNSIAVRGTISYIPPEYGMGAEVSTQGDVYGYGILLLEMLTGKRPTDNIFSDGLSLHDFSKAALPDHVMDIVDTHLLPKESPDEANNSMNQLEECLGSITRIGVACSMELMGERMCIKDVLKELHSVRKNLVQVLN